MQRERDTPTRDTPERRGLISKTMKLLIIPDVHNRVQWAENLVTAHPGHKVVFLGDYFDSYEDTPFMAGHTAEWLRYSLQQPERIHLMGNHDLPYRWKHMNCPGYHSIKGAEARRHLTAAAWDRVQFYHVVTFTGNPRVLVISHAGFTLANLYGVADYRDVAAGGRLAHLRSRLPSEHVAEIHNQGWRALTAAHEQRGHFWFNQGTRMGLTDVGGPFWLDRHEVRSPLPGIDQIVGHTHVKKPTCHYAPNKAKPDSRVWFIDGHGEFAAVVDSSDGLRVTPIHAQGEKLGQPVTTCH